MPQFNMVSEQAIVGPSLATCAPCHPISIIHVFGFQSCHMCGGVLRFSSHIGNLKPCYSIYKIKELLHPFPIDFGLDAPIQHGIRAGYCWAQFGHLCSTSLYLSNPRVWLLVMPHVLGCVDIIIPHRKFRIFVLNI